MDTALRLIEMRGAYHLPDKVTQETFRSVLMIGHARLQASTGTDELYTVSHRCTRSNLTNPLTSATSGSSTDENPKCYHPSEK